MTDFSFIQITDHHLLESEERLRDGFSPGHAFRMVMRHISEHAAGKADFIISTGDLVDPCTDAGYLAAKKLLGIHSSAALPGPQRINVEGLKDYPMYFLPGNHDDRELMTRHLFPESNPPKLYNFTYEHKGVQFVVMDWGAEAKAHLFPETRKFLAKALQAELPCVIVCHQQVKRVGYRWMDDFLADNIDEFWDVVAKPGTREKVLGILCGHIHNTYEEEYEGIAVLGLRSTAFPFARTDESLMLLAPPHYRFITIKNNILTSRVFTVPL
jgi:Icc protein